MNKMIKEKKRVFVGLSGGVDSAVAAALLKEQGYDVVGVFIRFWKDNVVGENSCCSVESEAAARLIAAKLKIPFYVFNFAKEFKREVVDYFLREMAAGRTPNPCVICNPKIKFGLFLERAQKLGADFVATGHYVRLRREFSIFNFQFSKKSQNQKFKITKLYKARDKQKDQSYFLYRLNQKRLARVIFPLGNYTKEEVYKLAKRWRLPYRRNESFDICFAGDYQEFLRKYVKMKEGKIIAVSVIPVPAFAGVNWKARIQNSGSRVKPGMTKEVILGQHAGLALYTIGQRARLGGPGPFYVVKKDIKKNILYVSNNECDLYQKEMLVEDINWISGQQPRLPFKCKVKIRYGGGTAEAVINQQSTINNKQRMGVKFQKPQRAITPGQSAVFYGRNGEVLGGGIIEK